MAVLIVYITAAFAINIISRAVMLASPAGLKKTPPPMTPYNAATSEIMKSQLN